MYLERTQYGYSLHALFVLGAVLIGVILLDSQQMYIFSPYFYLSMSVAVFLLLFFYKLKLNVDEEKVKVSFGPGWFSRTYQLGDIEYCRPVKNKFWYGFGIRILPTFTLYNISGLKAVELKFKGYKRKVRIGVRNPDEVSAIINHNLKKLNDSRLPEG